MGGRSFILGVLVAIWAGSLVSGATQTDYTVPAREQLFSGTLSGLAEAYQILDNGMRDVTVTGDKRELTLLHVVAWTGMLVFDDEDAVVTTSLMEIGEPFGVTLTGDKLFPEDPCDPDRVEVVLPLDPSDANCVVIPPGADPVAAVAAINNVILPELSDIISELDSISNWDSPTPFLMTLTPAEVNEPAAIEVDRGDVLVLRAALLGAKAGLYAAANGAYDLTVDPLSPLFEGWECGILPQSTTINAVLNTYPSLLRIQSGGAARLTQAKQNLITSLTAVDTALDYLEAETGVKTNDLLYIEDKTDPSYLAFRSAFDKLRTSLQNGTVQTYTLGSKQTFTLNQGGASIGELRLVYDPFDDEGTGYILLSDPQDMPGWWDIEWFRVEDGLIEGDAEGMKDGQYYWAWFEGSISSDGSQITTMTFYYHTWWAPYETVTGLYANRTGTELQNVQFNPNPIFAGSVSPRDLLPQFDPNNEPIVGTVGHGLGDDATLGGILPGLTQSDWMQQGYEVFGGSTDYRDDWARGRIFNNIDDPQYGYTKLGESDGSNLTVSGGYPYYVIVARGEFNIDSIQGSDDSYYNGEILTGNVSSWWNVTGNPDNQFADVGDDPVLELFGDTFTGYVAIANPNNWTGLTVLSEPGDYWTRHDWNGDDIVSIVGDVPPFVNCVYFQNYPAWSEIRLLYVGDCNGDGLISIVGDVPCFVNCVYFQNCP